jgi:hypothetical protein
VQSKPVIKSLNPTWENSHVIHDKNCHTYGRSGDPYAAAYVQQTQAPHRLAGKTVLDYVLEQFKPLPASYKPEFVLIVGPNQFGAG